jgi:opacity protein-like surface antigen
MKKAFVSAALLSVLGSSAIAADVVPQTCDQIRERIEAQTGLLPAVNIRLLQTLSLRQECRFTAAEVYRAAYGDKPPAVATAMVSGNKDTLVD